MSARTELRRAGPARYEGLCPFHEERTPSFGIDPRQKVYHCFGCQASGDVFTFVQETEGVDFRGALELLADRYGVELKREQRTHARPRSASRERLLELLSRTARTTSATFRNPARPRKHASTWRAAASASRFWRVPRGLRAKRMGSRPVGVPQRRILRGGAVLDRPRSAIPSKRAALRSFPFTHHVPAGGYPRTRPGFRRASDERGTAPEVPEHGRQRHLPQGPSPIWRDLARSHAARAGTVIVCEGYTDVIALHQAEMHNTVGLMGTALTGDQVGELSRMAQTVLLALDADSAGQEAMLRAAGLAAKRNLELRVVALPAGADPADLIQRDGAEAMAALVEKSAPFVRFRVERVLASGDHSSPEGQDRMLDELRPVFAQVPPGAMRMQLTRTVSSRLAVPESVIEQRMAAAPRAVPLGRARRARGAAEGSRQAAGAATSGARGRGKPLDGRENTERAFLALCLAAPEEGARALSDLDVDEHFSSELLRRAAKHLRAGDLRAPMQSAPQDVDPQADAELSALLAELVVESGRNSEANPAMLEAQRLQLELARVDRQIQRARGEQRGDVSDLARRKATVKLDFDRAYARVLEETGDRE